MKKHWNNPELKNLELNSTEETLCYCENGINEEVITYCGGKPHRPGHPHKPGDKPHNKPDNRPSCPPQPCPPPPENDDFKS